MQLTSRVLNEPLNLCDSRLFASSRSTPLRLVFSICHSLLLFVVSHTPPSAPLSGAAPLTQVKFEQLGARLANSAKDEEVSSRIKDLLLRRHMCSLILRC